MYQQFDTFLSVIPSFTSIYTATGAQGEIPEIKAE